MTGRGHLVSPVFTDNDSLCTAAVDSIALLVAAVRAVVVGKSGYLSDSGAVFVALFAAACTDLCNQWPLCSVRSLDAKLVPTSIPFAFFSDDWRQFSEADVANAQVITCVQSMVANVIGYIVLEIVCFASWFVYLPYRAGNQYPTDVFANDPYLLAAFGLRYQHARAIFRC